MHAHAQITSRTSDLMALEAYEIWFKYSRRSPDVVKSVSLALRTGESVGLVGESGSGKTSFARILLGTLRPTRGTVILSPAPGTVRCSAAGVFQDVAGSIDPLFRAGRAIAEASALPNRDERQAQTERLLEDVGLAPQFAQRFPHELSGGQRQRVSIARALASGARTLILDEPTSALDAHARLQIVDLLNQLRAERSLSYVVIAHDFQVVARLCSRVMVMLQGEIIEEGAVEAILHRPRHPYTKSLVRASSM